MKAFLKRNALAIIVFVLLLTAWELICQYGEVPTFVLPAPSRIFSTLIQDFSKLWVHSKVTLTESILGLTISTVLAIFLALIMDLHDVLRHTLHALLVVTQTIPSLVLAPLLMIWLGFGMAPKIVVVVLMCFYPITVSFSEGLQELSQEHLDLLNSFGANTIQIYRTAKIPAAIPSLFSGLRVAATYSVSAAVIAEWLSSKAGLGYYMIRVSNAYQLDKVFASLIMIIFWSLVMNGLIAFIRTLCEPGTGIIAKLKHNQWQKRINPR